MLEEILGRLDKVRKSGKNYTACCPVHDDNSPSMSITEKDGRVLMHCHSCLANGRDVVEALGLPIDVLFAEARERTHDPDWLLKKTEDEDSALIVIAYAGMERGERLKYSDRKALKVSIARRELRKQKGIPQLNMYLDWNPFDENQLPV